MNALGEFGRWWCVFWYVSWENILRSIEILAKLEVVYFGSSATVTVLSDNQVKHCFICRHQSETFEHSQELVRSNMQLLRAIEVHEVWLKENALSLDFVVHLGYSLHHLLLLGLSEDSLRFDVLD